MPDLKVLLISTYELGRQPFGLASPAARLRAAGFHATSLDLSRQALDGEAVRTADLIAFYLPMHTATLIAVHALERVASAGPTRTAADHHPLSDRTLVLLIRTHERAVGLLLVPGRTRRMPR